MDKIAMKQLLRGAGFPVLDFIWLTREELKEKPEEIVTRAESEIRYPMFIKPACLGSSIGVTRAKNREELISGLELAAAYDRRILVEVGIEHPTEINCAVLGYGDDIRTSVCEMPVSSTEDSFLNFWEKYLRNGGGKNQHHHGGMKNLARILPAPIDAELNERIQKLSRDIFHLLDCKGTVRVDFILDENDLLYVNEPNTIPGSLAFYLWKASNLSAYLRGTLFVVDNWDDRIYSYERDAPGNFTVPAYYGRGVALSFVGGHKFRQWKKKTLRVYLRVSDISYFLMSTPKPSVREARVQAVMAI